MANIANIDWDAKRFYLHADTVANGFSMIEAYEEVRILQAANGNNEQNYQLFVEKKGGDPKGNNKFTPTYTSLLPGWRGIPYNGSDHNLDLLDEIISEDQLSDRDVFVRDGLTNLVNIDAVYTPVETIQVNSAQIAFASYAGGITIDKDNLTGNAVPLSVKTNSLLPGTLQHPMNNLIDAGLELNNVGLGQVFVIGDLDISDEINWIRTAFIGDSPNKSTINVNPIANVVNCEFYNCTLSGTLDGNSYISNSIITGLNFVDGYIEECFLGPGTIQLGTSTIANFVRCNSNLPGPNQTPIIDHNGTGIIAIRDYTGGARSQNYSGSGEHSLDLARGQWILDNTITGGTWVFRGIGKLVDENGNSILSDIDSNGRAIPTTWNGATILNELLNQENIARGLLLYDSINLP